MNKALVALAFGSLAIGMTEFNMMGLLISISRDLRISIPQASHLISLYALGVVVGAPILVFLTSKMFPKRILLLFMLLFFVFNALFSISPSIWSLYLSRFISGLPHGAFFGVGSVVATKLSKPGKEATSIAIMFTGMTLANLLGIPLGTYIGQHFSWRLTYFGISLLGLVTMLFIYYWLPNVDKLNNNIREQVGYFSRFDGWLIIAIISIGTGGLFAWISFISPLVTKVSGLLEKQIPMIMFLVGLGMVTGNLLGGKLADKITPTKAVIISLVCMAFGLLLNYYISPIRWTSYPMAFLIGCIAFSSGSSLQMMLINSAKGAETFAASMGQAAFNIGNSLGAYFGAIPISLGLSYNTPMLVGAGMAWMGVMLSIFYLKRFVS